MADHPTPARTIRSEPGRVFRSAIGWPAWGELLSCALVAATMTLLLIRQTEFALLVAAGLIFSIAMATWLLAGTVYRIRDGALTVVSRFRRRQIPLADIASVKCWPHSSWRVRVSDDFGLASRRIEISYGESKVFVSPKNEEAFLAALGHPKDRLAT